MTRRAALCGELCRQHQMRIAGQVQGCTKRAPLCASVDPRLTCLRAGETLEVYLDLTRSIALGHRRAEELFTARAIPETADDWIELMLDAHRAMFVGSLPDHAGRLRTEDVYYGHHGHERPGAPPEDIRSKLQFLHERRLGDGFMDALADRAALCRWAAWVLTEFFEIHPFDDGNGRLARLFLSRVGTEAAQLTLRQSMNAKLRTRYRKSLQFAHSRSTPERWSPDWWMPLAGWVDKMLVPTIEDEAEEPPTHSEVVR